jgi:hypothetical protein
LIGWDRLRVGREGERVEKMEETRGGKVLAGKVKWWKREQQHTTETFKEMHTFTSDIGMSVIR